MTALQPEIRNDGEGTGGASRGKALRPRRFGNCLRSSKTAISSLDATFRLFERAGDKDVTNALATRSLR